jgi:hypothetical protein
MVLVTSVLHAERNGKVLGVEQPYPYKSRKYALIKSTKQVVNSSTLKLQLNYKK